MTIFIRAGPNPVTISRHGRPGIAYGTISKMTSGIFSIEAPGFPSVFFGKCLEDDCNSCTEVEDFTPPSGVVDARVTKRRPERRHNRLSEDDYAALVEWTKQTLDLCKGDTSKPSEEVVCCISKASGKVTLTSRITATGVLVANYRSSGARISVLMLGPDHVCATYVTSCLQRRGLIGPQQRRLLDSAVGRK